MTSQTTHIFREVDSRFPVSIDNTWELMRIIECKEELNVSYIPYTVRVYRKEAA